MECKDIRELFSEYYDSMEAEEEITQHLRECPECDREYDEYRQLLDEVQALPAPELPPHFHKTLLAGVHKYAHAQQMKQRHTTYKRIALIAASVLWATVWISGVFIFDNQDSRNRSENWTTEYFAPAPTPAADVTEAEVDSGGWSPEEIFPVPALDSILPIMPIDGRIAPPESISDTDEQQPQATPRTEWSATGEDLHNMRTADAEIHDDELIVRQGYESFEPFGLVHEPLAMATEQGRLGGDAAPDSRMTLGGTGNRAWLIALIGGIIPLGVVLTAVIISMSGIVRKKADEQHD